MSSFNISSQNIGLRDDCILYAECETADGDWVSSELNLNTCLGNNDGIPPPPPSEYSEVHVTNLNIEPGSFQWGGVNFAETASSISFSIEGGANQPILRAVLKSADQEPVEADVNLAERIQNIDGVLSFEY